MDTSNKFTVFYLKDKYRDIWFNANHVALVIGCANIDNAIKKYINYKNKCTLINFIKNNYSCKEDIILKKPETIYINNSGLASLILFCKEIDLVNKKKIITFLNKRFYNILNFKLFRNLKDSKYISKIKKIFRNYNCIKNYKKSNYRVDLYLKKLNVVIEFEDFEEYCNNYKKTREKYIINDLKCKYLKLNSNLKNFCIDKAIKNIHHFILKK